MLQQSAVAALLEKHVKILHNGTVNCKELSMRPNHLRQGLLQRLRRDRSAAAAAEMALLLPALLGMTFSVIQLGFAGVTYSAMMSSARTGAREMTFGMDDDDAEDAVRAQLPGWVRAHANITATEDLAGMARVQITVPAARASLIPFLPFPGNLSADITMPRVADR
ncbi:MAG: pilus assembly protein [Sandarakinorhabdus sp.]|nr:pilus assembly protein [Sandarakinorhabdus sp.]